MFDEKLMSCHAHLFYLEPAIYLLDKIYDKYRSEIYISLNEDGEDNQKILDYAKSIFKKVDVVITPNYGTDQYGFFNSFPRNKEKKEWLLYVHDKVIHRIDWLDSIVDPLLSHDEKKMQEAMSGIDYGIISTLNWKQEILTEKTITEMCKKKNMDTRLALVQARHTMAWYRELQYILLSNTGFICKENINPDFTAGNIFIARHKIVKLAHSCLRDNFFEGRYRNDGNVEHALERFYFYIPYCMNYEVLYV